MSIRSLWNQNNIEDYYCVYRMKSRIIAVANHKGGVGKTTTTSSLGSILASKGYKVLLVDLDAQANLTTSLTSSSDGATIYEAMTGKVETLPIVILHEHLHLVPASLTLAMADVELSSAIARERILSDLLVKSKAVQSYDFILFDCPPSLGLMTLNAFTASTDILIPLVAEVLPFKGLTMINDFIKMVHTRLNPQAHVSGILITRWEASNLSRGIENNLRQALGDTVFCTKIRKNVRLAEAPLENANIVDYDPRSNGASSGQPSTSLVPKVSDKSVKSDKEPSERVSEERFCTIVQSDILRKIRIIANREGLQIKEVVNAAFEKAIKSYERKNGPVDGRMKGDAKNLF